MVGGEVNWNKLRESFPQALLDSTYLDSAATTLKPICVIDRMTQVMREEISNVHRGGHKTGNRSTVQYEEARQKVAQFVSAKNPNEIVFTRGTTESINLVASSLAESFLESGDEIVLSQLEHHSNIVPWQIWAERKGLKVKFIQVKESGELDFEHFLSLLSPRTKVLALTHLSNALGVRVELKPFIKKAKEKKIISLVDGAQSVSAHPVDVQDLDCDFFVFSGHKIFGPTGIGVLYGREDLLNNMPPYQGGGSMIQEVTEDGSTFLPSPQRFEAGTPAIVEAIALGEALNFVSSLDWPSIQKHDDHLVRTASRAIEELGFQVFAIDAPRSHVVSFLWPNLHPSDFASLLSEMNIALRSGHHCCQPLMKKLGVSGTLRASFSIYSNDNDVDKLVEGLKKAKEMLV